MRSRAAPLMASCVLFATGSLSVGAPAAAPAPSGHSAAGSAASVNTHFIRVSTPLDLKPPILYQNLVAYAGQRAHFSRRLPIGDWMYTAKLRPWRPKFVTAAQVRVYLRGAGWVTQGWGIGGIGLSARWLLWQESAGDGSWMLLARRRTGGRTYVVDSWKKEGIPPQDYDGPFDSLYGDTAVWHYFNWDRKHQRYVSKIAVERLPSGRRRIIRQTVSPCDSVWPTIWGDTVVWHQEGICQGHRGSDVMMFNLRTNRLTQLTHNHGSSEAQTNGRYVVWKQGKAGATRFDYGAIVLLDLRTGKRRVISPETRNCGMPHTPPYCDDDPVVGPGMVAWINDAQPGSGVALDLRTGKRYTFVRNDLRHTIGNLGRPWGRYILWSDTWWPRKPGCCTDLVGEAEIP